MTLNLAADDPRAASLRLSIHQGDVATLRQLIGADPELARARIVDARGTSRTLLHIVADWPGHFPQGAQIVALLAAAGAALDAPVFHADTTAAPETALHWAASSNDVAVLDALLDAGADIEAPGAMFTGGTAMSDAVVFAQWDAARRLLARGATTTIWQAAALGLLDRLQAVVASEPPSPRDVSNAFWHACRAGQLETARFLVARGADINWVGHDHKTPLDVARAHGDQPLMQWMVGLGARGASSRTSA